MPRVAAGVVIIVMVVSLHAGDVRRAIGARDRGLRFMARKMPTEPRRDIHRTVDAESQTRDAAVTSPHAFVHRVRTLRRAAEAYVEAGLGATRLGGIRRRLTACGG